MTRITFVRHGSTYWNEEGRAQGHSNSSLNEAGKQQAKQLAERFRGEQWDAVYASDLLRTRQTAEI